MSTINRAHEALRDSEYTLQLMETCEDIRVFRIYYIACLTLLRTVGQVLICDSADKDTRRAAIDHFNKLKLEKDEHSIYFNFIQKERDVIIHEYEVNLSEYDQIVSYSDSNKISSYNLGSLYRPLVDMQFEGADVRDLIISAISWWKTQLTIVSDQL